MTPIEKLSFVKNDLNTKYIKLVKDVEKLLNRSDLPYIDFNKKLNKKLNKMSQIKRKFEILEEIFETDENDNI